MMMVDVLWRAGGGRWRNLNAPGLILSRRQRAAVMIGN